MVYDCCLGLERFGEWAGMQLFKKIVGWYERAVKSPGPQLTFIYFGPLY
jgi:hypothetical protein